MDWARAELERLTDVARQMAGPDAGEAAKLDALRTLIYKPGPWNEERPFAYGHENCRDLRLKLLPVYLATRRGNCVSMPILFLILARRLGLDIGLALAPAHLFLRHRDSSGRIINLETTSGAQPARDVWMRHIRPMSGLGVASGLYLRALAPREAVAVMASTVLEHLASVRDWLELARAAVCVLGHNIRDAIALAHLGQAYSHMCEDVLEKHGSRLLIPAAERPHYQTLVERNHTAFAAARSLGWDPNEWGMTPHR